MSSKTGLRIQGVWRGQLKPIAGAAFAGVLGIVLPTVLGIHLAVQPGEILKTAETQPVGVKKVALGRVAPSAIPGQQRKISALPLAPTRLSTLESVFDRYDYDLEAIAKGRGGVPPIFVKRLPGDWRSIEQAEKRKRMFVKTMLPLILKANAEIRLDRRRLLALAEESGGDPDTLSDGARYWLNQLAGRYSLDSIEFGALKQRVDIIPVSLALAQAANESGWGTSRFARQGNALFGQWTWDSSQGIAPKELQTGKGDYAVRKFDALGQSVNAYMLNLNTHSAYKPLRQRRARLRAAGQALSGATLAAGLIKYSQRGKAYIEEIQGMISYNNFDRYDNISLGSAALG